MSGNSEVCCQKNELELDPPSAIIGQEASLANALKNWKDSKPQFFTKWLIDNKHYPLKDVDKKERNIQWLISLIKNESIQKIYVYANADAFYRAPRLIGDEFGTTEEIDHIKISKKFKFTKNSEYGVFERKIEMKEEGVADGCAANNNIAANNGFQVVRRRNKRPK
jgi:hypothetical protein